MSALTMQAQIQQVVDKIAQEYKPEKIVLFGSAAAGEMREFSDVDLMIIKDTNTRFFDRIGEVLKIVWNISPKPPLDIIVYTPKELTTIQTKSSFVQNEIIKKGKVLYG